MDYERVNWENLPSTKTPINQTNLNKMENGIDQAGAEIFVGTEEPTAGEKVWFNKNENSIYVRNSNGVYEEFIKKNPSEITLIKKYYAGLTFNCNDIIESGIYAIDTNNTIKNGPTLATNNLNLLTVLNTGQVVQQVWNNYGTIFIRNKWWDSWSSWKKIIS